MKTLLSLLGVILSLQLHGENVGWLRDGSGIYPEASPPLEWSPEKNIVWKTTVGAGYSSPVVVGNCVLVASEPDALNCIDIVSGKINWTKSVPSSDLPKDQQDKVIQPPKSGGFMAATPASDGESAYIVIANGIVAAFDLKSGNRIWTQVVGSSPNTSDGRSASPIRIGDALIVHLTELYEFDAKSGRMLWTQPDAPSGYGTPFAAKIGSVDIVVVPEGMIVRVSDGKILAKLPVQTIFSSPVVSNGLLYMIDSSFSIMQLPGAAAGDAIAIRELWSDTIEGQVYSSPLVCDGLTYTSNMDGKLQILDVKNKVKTELQLDLVPARPEGQPSENAGRNPSSTVVYASSTLAGNHIFLSNNDGKTVVIEPGKNAKVVKVNELGKGSGSTPAFSGKYIFIRGGTNLYCIGEK